MLAAVVFTASGAVAQQPGAAAENAGRNRYIIQLQPGVDPDEGAQLLGARHGLGVEFIYRSAIRGFSAVVPPSQVAGLASNTWVRSIEPDRQAWAVGQRGGPKPPPQPPQKMPTGVRRIGAANYAAWGALANVNIAVIDTGISSHPDLNIYRSIDCTGGGPTGPKGGCKTGGTDGNGHGTHVAGTAAAYDDAFGVVGVAPGARLWSIRVLDNSGFGWFSWIVAGIDYVAQNGAQIDVANMSLSGQGSSPAMKSAIQNALNKGVVFVVAASNDGAFVCGAADDCTSEDDNFVPAAYSVTLPVITVSALADYDGLAGGSVSSTCSDYGPDDTLATFSNFGQAVTIAAPGVCILSTYKDGGYTTFNGTSMASPHVTGAVALYIAKNGRADNSADVGAIRNALVINGTQQVYWRTGSTNDPDAFAEPLVNVAAPY
jgi:subtilisin family serine protease